MHPPAPIPTRYLRTPQACAYLQFSERTLWNAAKAGEIPYALSGKKAIFDISDLDRFVETRKRTGPHRNPTLKKGVIKIGELEERT